MLKTILCAMMLLSSVAVHSATIEPVLYAREADSDIEAQAPIHSVVTEFKAKGGTLIRLEKDATPFVLKQNDIVFPACSGANNRSQTLWNILRQNATNIVLMPPHATRYGFDPYNGRANWNRVKHKLDNDEFVLWSGVAKSKKFGWDNFEKWLTQEKAPPEVLAEMKAYYDTHYYHPKFPLSARKVYITFAKNAHVHLFRLNQVNDSLENVIVLMYPLDDLIANPLPEWKTRAQSAKAYNELARIISSFLDFSQLTK